MAARFTKALDIIIPAMAEPVLSSPRSALRAAIAAATRVPEPTLLPALLEQARLEPADATDWSRTCCRRSPSVRRRASR